MVSAYTRRAPRNDRRMKKLLSSLLPGAAADARGAQKTKRINLALQGGGAHGAFTWGVLDHLLSDERLDSKAFPAPRRARSTR